MKGWVILQQLVPLIEARLASGTWPRTVPAVNELPPNQAMPARRIEFNCQQPQRATR